MISHMYIHVTLFLMPMPMVADQKSHRLTALTDKCSKNMETFICVNDKWLTCPSSPFFKGKKVLVTVLCLDVKSILG